MSIDEMEARNERFRIEDDKQAEWALKKIREAEADRKMWRDYYQEQVDKIDKAADDTIEYMEHLLKEYFNFVPHKVTKTGQEKYGLPSGELVRMPETIDFERDDEALMEWCKAEAPEYVKVKETVDWAGVKKYMKDAGIIPDGVTPVTKPAEFKVRAK